MDFSRVQEIAKKQGIRYKGFQIEHGGHFIIHFLLEDGTVYKAHVWE